MDSFYQPVCFESCENQLGEGPVWVARENALYWVDIKAPAIFRRQANGVVTRWTPPFRVCSIAPMAGGGFIAGSGHGFAIIDPAQDVYRVIGNPDEGYPYNRFNDGKVDRSGRFWAGTMDDQETEARGTLYRLDPSLLWTAVDGGYGITNGPAFDPSGRKMYHSDTALRTIYLFDIASDGSLSDKRIFAQFDEKDGHPDGMTTDAEGNLWVTFWDGWSLRCFAPSGVLLKQVAMPVARPTSCVFGGDGFRTLFITSARCGLEEAALAMQPLAGGVFTLIPEISGVADREFG